MRSGVLLATTLAATLCSPAPSLPSFPCHPPPASAAGREIPAHCADHLWLDQFAIPPAWRTVPPLVQLPDTLPACRKARCPALCPRSLAAPRALSKLSPPLPAVSGTPPVPPSSLTSPAALAARLFPSRFLS